MELFVSVLHFLLHIVFFCLFHFFYADFAVAEGALMGRVLHFGLEPVLNAGRVEDVLADRDLSDQVALLEFIEAYHAFLLLKLVEFLFKLFFFDK